MAALTEHQKACLRRDCIRIVLETGSQTDRSKLVEKAEEVFQFVIGASPNIKVTAPEEQTETTG